MEKSVPSEVEASRSCFISGSNPQKEVVGNEAKLLSLMIGSKRARLYHPRPFRCKLSQDLAYCIPNTTKFPKFVQWIDLETELESVSRSIAQDSKSLSPVRNPVIKIADTPESDAELSQSSPCLILKQSDDSDENLISNCNEEKKSHSTVCCLRTYFQSRRCYVPFFGETQSLLRLL